MEANNPLFLESWQQKKVSQMKRCSQPFSIPLLNRRKKRQGRIDLALTERRGTRNWVKEVKIVKGVWRVSEVHNIWIWFSEWLLISVEILSWKAQSHWRKRILTWGINSRKEIEVQKLKLKILRVLRRRLKSR
jgi:hypothetical protein